MAIENLNVNKDVPETLFVGVGGIGSDIVTRISLMCKPGEAEAIRFVAMDTNANDLKKIRRKNESIITIQTSSTQSVLDYLRNDSEARTKWFPNNTTLYPKTVSEGAGQVRAISRLALNATIKNGNIQGLYKAIDQLFLKNGGELKQALRVVVVASVAGGTGSGIAMIVGMLIREYLHEHYREKSAIIRAYLLLPGVLDSKIATEAEKISLRRNGYATIKEINAFMIKGSGFCPVRDELKRYKDLHIDVPTSGDKNKSLENLPFDFCFLLDRVDKSEESMETLEQYKNYAVESLYEQNIGPMKKDAFGQEDNVIKDFGIGNNLGRSRFCGIGASTLRFPYEDIADYVAYSRAIECIGNGDAVGQWLKYDNQYEIEFKEYKKQRGITDAPKPEKSAVYVKALRDGASVFDTDMKAYFSTGSGDCGEEVVRRYITALIGDVDRPDNVDSTGLGEVQKHLFASPEVTASYNTVSKMTMSSEYEDLSDAKGKLRTFESWATTRAEEAAESYAKAIFLTPPSVKHTALKDYYLESLFKTEKGAMHPNAVRYLLYMLQIKLQEIKKSIDAAPEKYKKDMSVFHSGADQANKFDVKKTKGEEESDLDSVVSLAEETNKKDIVDDVVKYYAEYSKATRKYANAVIRKAVLKIAIEYITRLSDEYEKFYNDFSDKLVLLSNIRDDIVKKLVYERGDNVRYIFSTPYYEETKRNLDEFARRCSSSQDNLLLPDELNADIFEAVKANVEAKRVASIDTYSTVKCTDIFDDALLGYFKSAVRRECDAILDMNIVKAIIKEQEFKKFFELNSLKKPGDMLVHPEIQDESRIANLLDVVEVGKRLANPGIAYSVFDEPRVISLCTFNPEILELRDIDFVEKMETLKISAEASDTISKYDLKFFNALYGITPDILSRFKAPESSATGDDLYAEDGGIYYDAYQEHAKEIGPDSTKSATISLHIDKRWDSITEMPELSLETLRDKMRHIHAGLVYGVLHGLIKRFRSSRYDTDKRIYALEDLDGEISPFTVSNDTECDEFYEVLDALYRDAASVTKIYGMVEATRSYDLESNHRYSESEFNRATKAFKIGDGHKAPTSLFEIPLMYYNSLPRSKMDDNELGIMIDSIISILENEVKLYEQTDDQNPYLARILVEQFELLVENFKNDEFNVNEAMRKNTNLYDNRVLSMVSRKICNKIKTLNISNFVEIIDSIRKLIAE